MNRSHNPIEGKICDLCHKPAVGFIREAVEQVPETLDEQCLGVRRFKPGEAFFYCHEHLQGKT